MTPPKRSKACTICGRRIVRMAAHLRDHRSGRIGSDGRPAPHAPKEKRGLARKSTGKPARKGVARRHVPSRKLAAPQQRSTTHKLTHINASGEARMVDVGAKPDTERRAVARGKLMLSAPTVALVRDGRTPKGDVLPVARVAGIMAAKRTSELIPLTHPLPLTQVSVDLRVEDDGIAIEATASISGKTGVEMEALTAVAIAGLTLYDMLKSVERGARLVDVRLVEKSGGRSGDVRLE